jgi:branched-chain amino acid transport system substrate-binding protein
MTQNNNVGLTRRKVLTATGTAAVVGTAGCLANIGGGDGNTYTIGMGNSLTGSLSAFGERCKRGKELALNDVNDVGVDGRELKILVEDTKSRPQPGVAAAQKLVNQNQVPLLIAGVGSGVTLAIYKSVVQPTNVVQISQNSTSPKLSNFPKLLRMSATGLAQSSALENIIKKDGYDSVAVTFINNAYGQGVAQAFKDVYDGEIAYYSSHPQGASTYSNVITAMHDSGAKAWVFITYQPEMASMATEAYSKGYTDDTQFYGADSTKGPKVLKQAPKDSISEMKFVIPSAPLDANTYQRFVNDFKKQFDRAPTVWAAYTYDAVIVSALTIQAASEFTGAAMHNVVKDVTRPPGQKANSYKAAQDILADGGSANDVDYQGVSGPIDLDKNGDPVVYLRIYTVENHEYKPIGFITGT